MREVKKEVRVSKLGWIITIIVAAYHIVRGR